MKPPKSAPFKDSTLRPCERAGTASAGGVSIRSEGRGSDSPAAAGGRTARTSRSMTTGLTASSLAFTTSVRTAATFEPGSNPDQAHDHVRALHLDARVDDPPRALRGACDDLEVAERAIVLRSSFRRFEREAEVLRSIAQREVELSGTRHRLGFVALGSRGCVGSDDDRGSEN